MSWGPLKPSRSAEDADLGLARELPGLLVMGDIGHRLTAKLGAGPGATASDLAKVKMTTAGDAAVAGVAVAGAEDVGFGAIPTNGFEVTKHGHGDVEAVEHDGFLRWRWEAPRQVPPLSFQCRCLL